MKETIVSILQQKMDKCTTEQFWATGAVTGLNVFLLTQKNTLVAIFTTWIIIILGFCVSAYVIYFIIHRHIAYYVMNDSLVEILKNEPSAPHILKTPHKMRKGNSLSGVVFYSGWVLLGFVEILFHIYNHFNRLVERIRTCLPTGFSVHHRVSVSIQGRSWLHLDEQCTP